MAHAIGAVDQYLRLAQILLGPVHSQAERVALVVHHAEALAAQQIPRHRMVPFVSARSHQAPAGSRRCVS
jgi:hypothetical protein